MLFTKLHRPPVSREHVYRTHLVELLEKNIHKPLTLVSAGAGYGKSMLVSSWLEKSKIPYAWVSLSDEDNDLRLFIDGISTSLRKKFPKALRNINNYLETDSLPLLNVLSDSLINGLDEIDKEFVLVLDDYHLIRNNQINELINKLLQFPAQHMQLVIITRNDPFLNLNSLRAHSRINEIRMADLCFNESEILELLKNIFQTATSRAISHKLMKQTEGWITGLRLLLLMVKKGEDLNESLEKIHAINPTTTDFLLEEVISDQPETIRNCLLKMSIPDRFCDELVNELCLPHIENLEDDIIGKDVIQTLLKANLFTISLDYERKWYRFHHLFKKMLQNQLKKQHSIDEINSYHLKASEWFDKNDFKEEAVKHALKGHKIDLAADLVSRYRFELLDAGKIHRLDDLIDLLPLSIIEETPALLTAKGFIMDYHGQMPELFEYKEKAKAILSDLSIQSQEMKAILGEVKTIEGELFILSGDTKSAFEYSRKALDLLPDRASHAQSFALGTQVLCYQMNNDIESAKKAAIEFPPVSYLSITRMQFWYSMAYAMEGNLVMVKKHTLNLIKLGKKHGQLESVVFGKYFISMAHYLSNEDELAKSYLEAVVNDPYVARSFYLAQCAFMLSAIHIDNGEVKKADQLMDFIIRHFEETNEIPAIAIAKAMQVELALKRNDIDKAQLLNKQLDSYELIPPLWFVYVPQLTPVKLKLVINTAESIAEAIQILTEIEQTLRQTNKKAILIDVFILQALALKAQKKPKEASLKITEALSLSSIGGSIRMYIDYGKEVKELFAGLSIGILI
ncbi:hypothetical protein [uncultured Eudoraea sp.]|uniref:hypothetical protein n=3 Tax=Eudoraea TaxID=446680 RepID=UPI00260D1048|nr:hypothetical protein [uncultured Eudoraea sp.]